MVEAIAQEMERDPGVLVLGEDVAKYGGIFSSTAGCSTASARSG